MKKEKTYRALSIAVLALVLIFALIGWIHTPYDPDLMDGSAKYLQPDRRRLRYDRADQRGSHRDRSVLRHDSRRILRIHRRCF